MSSGTLNNYATLLMDSVAQVINYEVIKAFLLLNSVFTYNRLMNLSNISFSLFLFQINLEWNSTEDVPTFSLLEMVRFRDYPWLSLHSRLGPI